MHASTITKSLIAAVSNGVALSQSLLAAGPLTINGSLAAGGVATFDSQRQVIITSAGDDSALTWTVIGTDDNGSGIKDSFAGQNGVATSNLNFKTVTSLVGSGATAAAVTAGTNGVGASPWKIFASTIATPHMAFDFELLSGSANASVQYTQEAFLAPITTTGASSSLANGAATPNPTAHDIPALSQMTGSLQDAMDFAAHGWRLIINSGTGSCRLTGRQAGLASP